MGEAGRARIVGACLAVQALLALERDAAFLGGPGGSLPAPPRAPLYALVALQILLGLAVSFLDERRGRPARVAGLALGVGTLFLSCPFTAPRLHALQALLLVVVGGLVLGLGAPRGTARLVAVLLPCFLVEGAFALVPRSHAVGYSLAARLWFSTYWTRTSNALGYRDVEHVADGRARLFVVGDSFVAGVGIADVAERFSDRLQALTAARYQVHNLGWNGADSAVELERLKLHPLRPDVVVLSYFVNDITGAAAALGHLPPRFHPYHNLPGPLGEVVRRSFALDFAYWLVPQDDLAAQGAFLVRCFDEPEVVARQQAQLEELVAWSRAQGARVLCVAFPDLAAPEQSGPWLAPALDVFRRLSVPVVDVRELVRGRAPAELTVNRNDSHPSAWVHARVAERLAEELARMDAAPAR